jgi:general secretion pathway protein G
MWEVTAMKGWIRRSGGFTLIEIVIVLAIIAILAGILAPVLTRYVGDSKIRRAEGDCQRIAAAMGLFYSDVGEWPIWKDGTNFGEPNDAKAKLLDGSAGDVPTFTGTGWTSVWINSTFVDSLTGQLGHNVPSSDASKAYPTTGKRAWRGPYLAEGYLTMKPDPWGVRYLVNVEFLWPQNINGSKPVFVISGGPDKEIDTAYDQTGPDLTVSDDDIAFRIK